MSASASTTVTSCSISEQPGVQNIDGNELTNLATVSKADTHETNDESKIENNSVIVVAGTKKYSPLLSFYLFKRYLVYLHAT